MTTVYLSLGSNMGDRAENIARAIAALGRRGVRVTQESSLYETEPLEIREQPWFLNCAIAAETELSPERLMRVLLEIEREMGRERILPKGPRLIDMDILLYGSNIVKEPRARDSSSANGGAEICACAAGGDCGGGESSGRDDDDCRDARSDGGSERGEKVAG